MKKFSIKLLLLVSLSFLTYSQNAVSQQTREVELKALEIVARVDDVLKYPPGLLKGNLMHIYPTGKKFSLNIQASITGENFLFLFGDHTRGDQIKVLFNLGGEDIWVYNILSLKLFHKIDIDKFDPLLNTNFNFYDISNADLQSNYNPELVGETIIKGKNVFFLKLKPIYKSGDYGGLRLYVTKDDYVPIKIDFLDKDGVVFKIQTIAQSALIGKRVFPVRYDMLHLKSGTLSILNFFNVDNKVSFSNDIFRHDSLSEKK